MGMGNAMDVAVNVRHEIAFSTTNEAILLNLFTQSFYKTNKSVPRILQDKCSNAFQIFAVCSPAKHSHLKTSLFRTNAAVRLFLLLLMSFFSPSFCTLFLTFISESDCSPYETFYKGSIHSNQQLAVSRLMHNIHCGSTIFPCQALA